MVDLDILRAFMYNGLETAEDVFLVWKKALIVELNVVSASQFRTKMLVLSKTYQKYQIPREHFNRLMSS